MVCNSGCRNYFVDEAGDGVLFNARGRVIVGKEGCSRTFMLGVLDVAAPADLAEALETLRGGLIADPYFRGVPSMQPEAGKTATAFHATDDLPEVRREVFSILAKADVSFQAVVKRKEVVLDYVLSRNVSSREYRYHPNELYDLTVRRLFKPLLHTDAQYNVCFAKRGKSDRTAALKAALSVAQTRFSEEAGLRAAAAVSVWPCPASRCACLQAVDYFLWALQRLYERGEERYLASIWDKCGVVVDIDDTREAKYGVYYTKNRPLSLAALEDSQGI
jgi:hypothetical protein